MLAFSDLKALTHIASHASFIRHERVASFMPRIQTDAFHIHDFRSVFPVSLYIFALRMSFENNAVLKVCLIEKKVASTRLILGFLELSDGVDIDKDRYLIKAYSSVILFVLIYSAVAEQKDIFVDP